MKEARVDTLVGGCFVGASYIYTSSPSKGKTEGAAFWRINVIQVPGSKIQPCRVLANIRQDHIATHRIEEEPEREVSIPASK